MAEYKVKALSVGGLGNKIFSFGDFVTDENFPRGNAKLLVEQGFLEPVTKEDEIEPPAPSPVLPPSIEQISKAEIIKKLQEAKASGIEIEFDENANKKVLYKIWIGLQ
ncbi:MAG: hypothetical protein K0S44_227 [Bacteroidetes bacterium]|jgi:hypothetical protein|nr:hypothetical protein [Bacteroidota bacterium]